MPGTREFADLMAVARAGLSGETRDLADLLDLLKRLEPEDKKQFWDYLKAHNPLLGQRLKRAKQRVEANPPKPAPWYAKRLGSEANAV